VVGREPGTSTPPSTQPQAFADCREIEAASLGAELIPVQLVLGLEDCLCGGDEGPVSSALSVLKTLFDDGELKVCFEDTGLACIVLQARRQPPSTSRACKPPVVTKLVPVLDGKSGPRGVPIDVV
jgi:hypothetical protein